MIVLLKNMHFDFTSDSPVLIGYNTSCSATSCKENKFISLSNPANNMKNLLGAFNKKLGADAMKKKNAMDFVVFRQGKFARVSGSQVQEVKKVLCSNNGYFTL
mmetsp:Transcript_55113/g.120163  ORF Transcript_55113/g.120163 Transcript_55113/m.120163 type:complete len:103 (+) Transcript_55113:127-435(+)